MSSVIWITGLSAAGKTTLGRLLFNKLQERGRAVVILDGDELREALSSTGKHDVSARLELAYKYSRLARLIAVQGVSVVVCTVALFHEIHLWNRNNLPGYFEVYLKVPLDELKRRDPKGIYSRYYRGELKDVAGLDMKIEEPKYPDLVIKYQTGMSPEFELEVLLAALDKS